MATVPVATWVFGAIGAAALLRGLWNPRRALAKEARVEDCPGGSSCDPTVTLSLEPGSTVYSAGSGRVVSVGPDWIQIALSDEPIVLGYFNVRPDVQPGQDVGRGQAIAAMPLAPLTKELRFGVWAVTGTVLGAIEPTSWLAAHGFALASTMPDSPLWCAQGRHITVPADVHNVCKLGMPAQPDFLLLPVTVSQG